MFATCAFSATSPCCLGTETRRRLEFTGVELGGGAGLAAPMEKATAGCSGGEGGPRMGDEAWHGGGGGAMW